MARSKSKAECLILLFDELHKLAPATSRAEAHALISNALDKIEDKYSGVSKTFQDDGQRMYFWSFNVDAWENTSGDPARLSLRGDHTAFLFNDGTIKIERHTCAYTKTVFFLQGNGCLENDKQS